MANDVMRSLRECLAGRNVPEFLLEQWEKSGFTNLLPIQARAIDGGCLDGKNCIIIGPTSCGKTFAGELACVAQMLANRRCLYLVPFKALAEEKHAHFREKYATSLTGASIIISTADRREHDRLLSEGDFHIAILTYEKLSALLVRNPAILNGVGAIVVDEVQLMCDPTRGAELELLLTRARQVATHVQIIALSAVVSDLAGFDKWLGAVVINDDHRPVPLREGVLIPNGQYEYMQWTDADRTRGTEKLKALASPSSDDFTVALTCEVLSQQHEQVLVFVTSVRDTSRLAQSVAARCKSLAAAPKTKAALAVLEESESVEGLLTTLDHAIGFHNADLTLEERLALEKGFASGEIRCLIATTTLSMGVNLPASTVIISQATRQVKDAVVGWHDASIPVAEYRNMSGRAGRFGLRTDALGRSFLICMSPMEQEALVRRYLEGGPEPFQSALLKQPLDIRVLKIIASGLCNTEDGIRRFLLKTFAAATAWATESAVNELRLQIETIIGQLVNGDLVSIKANKTLAATELGRICAASGLSLRSFDRVLGFVKRGSESPTDTALVASQCEDAGPDAVGIRFSTQEYQQRTPLMVRELREHVKSESAPLTDDFLSNISNSIPPVYDTAREIKFLLTGLDYVNGVRSRDIENRRSVPSGRARAIGGCCSWIAETGSHVAWALGRSDQAQRLERLADRFRFGCTEPALLLAQIPYTMHRSEREAVVAAGFDTLQKVLDTPPQDIAKAAQITIGRVHGLQKAVTNILGDALELERGQLHRLRACEVSVDRLEQLYAAKDKLLEQAIAAVLDPPFCPLVVKRITRQREGEADLHLILSSGRNGIAQITAKESPTDRVSQVKSGLVLQQSPELQPQAFICFGRPDFDKFAIQRAAAHAQAGTNFKLVPVCVLAEMYVRYHENRITPDRVREILEVETGYITIDRL